MFTEAFQHFGGRLLGNNDDKYEVVEGYNETLE